MPRRLWPLSLSLRLNGAFAVHCAGASAVSCAGALTACCAALVAVSCANDAPEPPFEVDVPVSQSTLDNGLEVLVIPNHTAPAVTALVAFRAGSSVEDASLNGYSHLFEHMIFQGSREVPSSEEFGDKLEALGASYNATTRQDSVTYYFTAPSDTFEDVLALYAGALKEPALDEGSLDKERKVVLSEADLNESSPTFAAYRTGLNALFGDYAVRLDPLGSREVVMNVTRDDLLGMLATYYVPNNAMLVLSGDLSPDSGKALASRYFADWERAPDPFTTPPPKPEPLEESSYHVLSADLTNTRIELWWQSPSAEDDLQGAQAGQMLGSITSQAGHPFRTLVGSDRALSAQFGVSAFRRAGYAKVVLVVPNGNERSVLRALGPLLAQLGDDVTQAQLQTAREAAFNGYLQTVTTPDALPQALGLTFGLQDPAAYFDTPNTLYAVTRHAMRSFVRNYVRDKPKVVVLSSSEDNLAAQGIDEAWLAAEAP